MDNLLPQFHSAAGARGWEINLNDGREKTPPRRYNSKSPPTSNSSPPSPVQFKASSFTKKFHPTQRQPQQQQQQPPHQQRRQTQRAKSAGRTRQRAGAAMQFFRPGSVLRDNVPALVHRPRPKTTSSPHRTQRRSVRASSSRRGDKQRTGRGPGLGAWCLSHRTTSRLSVLAWPAAPHR